MVALLLAVSSGGTVRAEQVAVLHSEGLIHGFLVLRTLEGKTLADGEIEQVAEGNLVQSHLAFHFRDGSLYDERATFSQAGRFKLVSDRIVEKGPAFKQPVESTVDAATGRVTCRYADDGQEKSVDQRMSLPDDIANGLLFTLLRHIKPTTPETIVSEVAMTPTPRFGHLAIRPLREEAFSVGSERYKAMHYVVKIKIGGLAGLVAPLIGKQPPDLHVWIKLGNVPAFVKFEGPIYSGGPAWRVEMADAARFP